jgi:hypothetical protein
VKAVKTAREFQDKMFKEQHLKDIYDDSRKEKR